MGKSHFGELGQRQPYLVLNKSPAGSKQSPASWPQWSTSYSWEGMKAAAVPHHSCQQLGFWGKMFWSEILRPWLVDIDGYHHHEIVLFHCDASGHHQSISQILKMHWVKKHIFLNLLLNNLIEWPIVGLGRLLAWWVYFCFLSEPWDPPSGTSCKMAAPCVCSQV